MTRFRLGPRATSSYGLDGLLVDVDTNDHPEAAEHLCAWLRRRPDVAEARAGWSSVYVRVDDPTRLAALRDELSTLPPQPERPDARSRDHRIAVRYDGADLAVVAELTGLGASGVIRAHTEPEYTVGFLGFTRAFPYLRGLDPRLVVDRLPTARPRVPGGSVAIAGQQCGVYAHPSPGGWRLLGTTDDVMFDPSRVPAGLLAPGDRVVFRSA